MANTKSGICRRICLYDILCQISGICCMIYSKLMNIRVTLSEGSETNEVMSIASLVEKLSSSVKNKISLRHKCRSMTLADQRAESAV